MNSRSVARIARLVDLPKGRPVAPLACSRCRRKPIACSIWNRACVFPLRAPAKNRPSEAAMSKVEEVPMSMRPNEGNERIKRRFLEYRQLDREIAALERFDVWNGRKDFSRLSATTVSPQAA